MPPGKAQGSELQGIRLFAVNNASNPPPTQVHGKDCKFCLPDGTQIDRGMAIAMDSCFLFGRAKLNFRLFFT
jgi:hypothetical protein